MELLKSVLGKFPNTLFINDVNNLNNKEFLSTIGILISNTFCKSICFANFNKGFAAFGFHPRYPTKI